MKDEEARVTERQRLIGAKTVCELYANLWKEHAGKLNGNRDRCLIEIDGRRNERTLGNIKMLWEILEEKKRNMLKNLIVSRIVLNVPGVWENSFPKLKKIAMSENGSTVFYDEIESEENLEKAVNYLKIGATNKISLLFIQS